MAARTTSRSRNEEVYAQLRADILSGRLEPGQRLPFADLIARYASSVGVIREALQRVVEQGLVESEAQQGFRVVSVSADDLLDLTTARCDVESLALRHAIAEGDMQWEGRILAAHHVMERSPEFEPEDPARLSDAWAAAHREFHQALLEGCANRRILDVATGWRDSAELYRRWSVRNGGDQPRDIAGEHRGILEACLARSADLACERLTAHIRRTTEKLIAALETHG